MTTLSSDFEADAMSVGFLKYRQTKSEKIFLSAIDKSLIMGYTQLYRMQ